MTNAIVVPAVYIKPDHKSVLETLLESIKDYPVKVVVCHDNSPWFIYDYFVEKYPNFIHLNHEGNRLNFCGNANKGLRYAYNELKADKIALVNMDCVLPNWIYFQDLFKEKGLVSAESTDQEDLDEYNQAAEDGPGREFHLVDKFAGYCYVIDRKVIDKIGFLDESFKAGFDDDDYIVRAKLAGFPVSVMNVCINHKGSHIEQTNGSLTGAYNSELLMLNLQKYYWKYQIPANVTHQDAQAWIVSRHTWQDDMYEA